MNLETFLNLNPNIQTRVLTSFQYVEHRIIYIEPFFVYKPNYFGVE